MATITDYDSLVSAATEYLARDQDTTLIARIPTFIQLFEAKINRVLLHPKMEVRSTTAVDTGNSEPEFITLPSDFQTMRRIRLSGVTGKPRLQFMSQTQLEDYRYSIENVTDQPVYFSIVGDELELAPTPNEDYTLEMVYRANIPALTSSNTTNWLLTLAPDLYLYGTLLESAPYLKEDERIAVWAAGVQTTIDQLNTHGDRQTSNSGPTSISLPGVVV
jgi:hypothetical protein